MPASFSDGGGPPAPVNVVVGDEELLVERAVAALLTAARTAAPAPPGAGVSTVGTAAAAAGGIAATAVSDLLASSLAPGQLASMVSPSLFGGGCVAVIRSIEDAGKEVAAELISYAAAPAEDAVLVLTHGGAAKGKGLLDSLLRAGAHIIRCPKITRFGERMDFVRAEFRAAGRRATEGGVRALIDAVGNGLRELAAACSQLAADTTGIVDEAAIATYYRGRAEASGFSVADQAIEGRLGPALEQLRWALAVGVSPVLVTSALAQGVRALARVGGAPRGRGGAALAAELGMPPWKVDRVRQQLRGWNPGGIARALQAVADADAEVKGGGTNPAYALERAITRLVAARSSS